MRASDWRQQAKCRGMDTAIFFPAKELGGPGAHRMYDQAKAVCAECPVQVECLEDQLAWEAIVDPEHGSPVTGRRRIAGYFGGKTPKERTELHRERRLGI